MGKVFVTAAVTMDGFVADDKDTVGPLFDWYVNGDVPFEIGDGHVFHVSAASAKFLESEQGNVRAVVAGRRTFNVAQGWQGVPPAGDHVFVVTHEPPADWAFPDAPFTFVTDGVTSAIEQAKAAAGDGDVSVAAGEVGGQAIDAGLVDEVQLSVVPVLFGTGRPFFGTGGAKRLLLENPRITEGNRVTHLVYSTRGA